MTNELEKQFFDTFGIEPKLTFYDLIRLKEDTNQEFGGRCNANWQGETKEETIRRFSPKGWKVLECKDVYIYPQITDHILLELIRLGLNYDFVIHSKSAEELKEKLLVLLMYNEAEFKQQVQELFKECE